jgi:hypothetical protein
MLRPGVSLGQEDRMGSVSASTVLLTPSLIAKSVALHADLAAVIKQSREVLGRSRELILLAYPRIRHIGGGSGDIGLISTTITGASLCLDCIARKTGVPVRRVDAMLTTVAAAIKLVVKPGRCDGCLGPAKTFSVSGLSI